MPAVRASPSIVIIGAGFGGLAVALELKRHGIDSFEVLERGEHVGGVWQANTYPGAACDVPSVIYQFSYALKPDWSRRYGTQAEIRDYLQEVAEEHGILPHVSFGREVVSATWDEPAARWRIATADGETREADVLICATGQLSRPRIPAVPGRETFGGAQFHSAEWDHDVDLRGRRVALVGGGASAIQVGPAIVDEVAHLTVVQRSPSWIVNKYDWTPSRLEKALLRRFPVLQRAYHNGMWLYFESRYPVVKRAFDPVRRLWMRERRARIRRTIGDPAKAAAATPGYAMGCNRLLLSTEWYPMLARPDVDLAGAAVTGMTERGLVCADGTAVDADVVIWCTGFTATEYLAPIEIRGRDGTIREAWADGPEAYLGLVAPGFPNLFMAYGPNTNSLTNTVIYLLERQAAYMRQAIEHLARTDGPIDVRRSVHDTFNAEVQRRMGSTVFTTGCPGWYTTDAGKVTQVWVGSHVEYGRRTERFDPAVFEQGARAAA
jgi:cation diffusion facilitator CzcD-associated flavoprotein CzcO